MIITMGTCLPPLVLIVILTVCLVILGDYCVMYCILMIVICIYISGIQVKWGRVSPYALYSHQLVSLT